MAVSQCKKALLLYGGPPILNSTIAVWRSDNAKWNYCSIAAPDIQLVKMVLLYYSGANLIGTIALPWHPMQKWYNSIKLSPT